VPPEGWKLMAERTDLIRAVDLALAGNWDGAHAIVQRHEADADACWIHALLHKIEGDEANSRYWYRRSGHAYDAFGHPRAELEAIRAALTQTH
jgi:hypothetical protein